MHWILIEINLNTIVGITKLCLEMTAWCQVRDHYRCDG